MIKSKTVFSYLGFIWNLSYLIGTFNIEFKGVTLLYISILLVTFLINSKKKWVRVENSLSLPLIFFLYPVVAFFFHPITDYAEYKILSFIFKCGVVFLLPFQLKHNIYSFMKGYLWSSLFFILLIIIHVAPSIGGFSVNNRLSFDGLNAIWIARFAFEGLLLALIVFNDLKIFRKKFIILALTVLTLLIVYSTGSKGPLLSALLIIGGYFFGKYNKFKHQKIVFVCLIFAFIFSKNYLNITEDSYLSQRFMHIIPDEVSDEAYEKSRGVVWIETVQKVIELDFNLFFGEGFGNYSFFYLGREVYRFYPHNLFLELLVEGGIIYLFVFLLLVKKFHKNNKFKYLFYYAFLNSMFSGDILLNETVFLYLAIMFNYQINFNKIQPLKIEKSFIRN